MANTDANPGPIPGGTSRDGPRPLPLHLATAMVGWTSSLAALPIARSGSPLWNPPLRREGEALARDLAAVPPDRLAAAVRSEEHTTELQSLMRNSYAVFCLTKKKTKKYLTLNY